MDTKVVLAKGKRGIVRKSTYKGKVCAIKEANPSSNALSTIEFEYEMLLRVNKLNIGPKVYDFKQGKLYMELVEGKLIGDYILVASREKILLMLKEVLSQLHKLDKIGLNKSELTNPYKHIIITKDKVVQIDFERCRPNKRPQNITQFMNYILRPKISKVLLEKQIYVNPDKIRKLSQDYKKSDKVFKKLVEEVLQKSFATKVYRACANIPKGKVASYKEIAESIGSKAYRAVGQVMRNNPFAPIVPCHRVIASDGTLGGFATGIDNKIKLLKKEGIIIKNKRIS